MERKCYSRSGWVREEEAEAHAHPSTGQADISRSNADARSEANTLGSNKDKVRLCKWQSSVLLL